MQVQAKIFFLTVSLFFLHSISFAQGLGASSNSVKTPENFEHIDCGFRFPFPGKYTLSTSVGYSPYRELGQGKIDQFWSSLARYDIGCIALDDPPRKMPKNELISSLNSMTKAYLGDSSEFSVLPAATVSGKEIYEFETKTDFLRRIKYVLEGNRVFIFIAGSYGVSGIDEALKLFNSVKYFSVRETAEKRMQTAAKKTLSQSPAVKLMQTDAARNNFKGRVKSVRLEAEDVPIRVGTAERRIESDESYDIAGNLLKSFWFQDSGYPTSFRIYGFIDGSRVSDSEELDEDSNYGLVVVRQGDVKLPPADTRYEYRYADRYDDSKRLIERQQYNNRGTLSSVYTFTFQDDWVVEKRLDPDGKLISTKRRQFDKNGNELRYEFWWYDQTDKEVETYEYQKFDQLRNWTQRRVTKTIIARGLTRTRTHDEFRTITYYGK